MRRSTTLHFLIACSIFSYAVAVSEAKPDRPNVLIFMTDDIGYGDIDVFNPQKRETITPHIDRLAKTGISFHHAHSPAAVCAPTRYAIITGNHVYRGRLPNGTWNPDDPSQITKGQETLGDRLQRNGYRTAFFGKTHLGGIFRDSDGNIVDSFNKADLSQKFNDGVSEHGFDYSLSLPSGIQKNPFAFFRNDRMVRYDRTAGEFKVLAPEEVREHFRIIVDEKEKLRYSTEVRGPMYAMDNYTTESAGPLLMQDALRFLEDHFESHPDKPFYIHYMSQAGHRPYAPPLAFNVDDPLNTEDPSAPGAIRVKGVTPTKRTDMIHESDVALGLFMDKLKEAGQLRNTIIIYTSDNGAEISERIAWSNPNRDAANAHPWYKGPYGGNRTEFAEYAAHADETHVNGQGVGLDGLPLRGMKSFSYEGGHRVPLIIRWGGGTSANSVLPPNVKIYDQLISLTDLYRTVCSLAGVKAPDDQALDSFDFSQVLTNPLDTSHRPVRKSLAVQAPVLADTSQANKRVRMGWAFYSRGPNGEILNALFNLPKSSKDFKDARLNEIYLLSEDEDQSNDVRATMPDLAESLQEEFTAFLKMRATHTGQLAAPERAKNWREIVMSQRDG